MVTRLPESEDQADGEHGVGSAHPATQLTGQGRPGSRIPRDVHDLTICGYLP